MRRALTTAELRRKKVTRDEFLGRPRRPITVVLDGVSQNYNIVQSSGSGRLPDTHR